jgi:transcriptional regulator with XRE-family HTH domain
MTSLLGETIRKRRDQIGLTQEELGKKIGVEATTVSLYESDSRKPKLTVLRKISSVLDVSLAALLGIEVRKTDLDIALRSHGLRPEDIEQVRQYIQFVKKARKNH